MYKFVTVFFIISFKFIFVNATRRRNCKVPIKSSRHRLLAADSFALVYLGNVLGLGLKHTVDQKYLKYFFRISKLVPVSRITIEFVLN